MKAKRLLFLTIMALCATSAWAYDFSAVAPSGQTLYYNIVAGNAQVTYQTNVVGQNYTNLTGDLVIPASVTYDNITYSVTSIGGSAFSGCTGLTSVTIPNFVTSIGSRAFYYCTGLISVTIPNSVTSIGEYAFYNVRHIEYYGTATGSPWGAITMNGVTEGDFVYADETKQQLLAYVGNGGDVTIPSTVNVIGERAFFGCTGLTSVTIPNSVTSIGSNAFRDCTGLTSVFFNADSCGGFSYDTRPFISCPNITSFTFGNNVRVIPAYICYYMTGLTSITIPNSVTSIGGSAFSGCTGLTSVTIPNSVTSIGNHAFSDCTGLTSVTIPNSVTSIGSYAFDRCTGLTTVTIPNSVTSIGEYAFRNCTGLTSVTIPNSVTSIGYYAFYGCTGLTSVTIPNSVTSIGSYAFDRCTGLTTVTIPNSVTSIGSSAFYGCSGMTTVTIGNSVTSIGSSAFSGCSGLINFVSRATYPPACGNNVFNNVPAYCTLTVPCGSQVYYSVTSPWNSSFPIMNEDCRDEYTVTAISDDSMMGSASVDGAETATVLDGDVVTVIATSNPGYHFLRWNDNNTDSVRTVEVHGNVTYTAYFASNSTEAIDDVNGSNIKVYVIDGRIVVEGRESRPVWVFDMYGRVVDNGQLPSGVYLVKVGNLPARKVVVIR